MTMERLQELLSPYIRVQPNDSEMDADRSHD